MGLRNSGEFEVCTGHIVMQCGSGLCGGDRFNFYALHGAVEPNEKIIETFSVRLTKAEANVFRTTGEITLPDIKARIVRD